MATPTRFCHYFRSGRLSLYTTVRGRLGDCHPGIFNAWNVHGQYLIDEIFQFTLLARFEQHLRYEILGHQVLDVRRRNLRSPTAKTPPSLKHAGFVQISSHGRGGSITTHERGESGVMAANAFSQRLCSE